MPRADASRELLRLLSPALRIEPGLLRAARAMLPGGRVDAGVEIEFCRDRDLRVSVSGIAIDAQRAQQLREEWRGLEPARRKGAAELIGRWHAGYRRDLRHEEVLALAQLDGDSVSGDEVQHAVEFFASVAVSLETGEGLIPRELAAAWFRRVRPRIPPGSWLDERFEEALRNCYRVAFREQPEDELPPGIEPGDLDDVATVEPRNVRLVQVGDRAVVDAEGGGSPLVDVWAGEDFAVSFGEGGASGRVRADAASAFELEAPEVEVPSWAVDAGVDRFGVWVAIEIEGVRQRMRWIEPGTFSMGSPEDEVGRDSDEAHHLVELTQGYWLFDTPVTQALWEAVVGDNPSAFRSPQRPVENVSWDDAVERFLSSVNERVPGLDLRLPTEAEWERACRAGTETATYTGDLELSGANNAPILDEIAWYGGNSGVEFDLEKGWDSSDWDEKQYEHTQAGARIVERKRANRWGLFDMLGNAWEWCSDWFAEYGSEAVDPAGPSEGVNRVLRGGSWIAPARNVRAACRAARRSGFRRSDCGFRCARGQSSSSQLSVTGAGRADEVVTKPRFSIATPRGEWIAEPFQKPQWAVAMGRDRFGLWAQFEVGEVRHRLRWIPPGRFLMGSPEQEPGRFGDERLHEVELTQGYWLGATPVTQALWEAATGQNPSEFGGSPDRPVENVSWKDVVERFVPAMSERVPRLGLRLPTEAEWEHACRAGTVTPNYVGDERELDTIAWFGDNSGGATCDVGGKQPNAWGGYDMLGNVWEWCSDWHCEYGDGTSTDPVGLDEGGLRVLRGGSWSSHARSVRAACRRGDHPGFRGSSFGFRCARGQE